MNTFETLAKVSFAHQVTTKVNKVYIVEFAGRPVRARFLGAENRDLIVHEGKGRRTRIMKVIKKWELL